MKIFKVIMKGIGTFAALDLLYFIILKIVLQQDGDTDTLLMAEALVFCGLFYAYLGIKLLRYAEKDAVLLKKTILSGVIFFIIGILIILGPVQIITGLCCLAGDILFGIENDSNVQIVLLWLICSIVTALICYNLIKKDLKEMDENK